MAQISMGPAPWAEAMPARAVAAKRVPMESFIVGVISFVERI
jgi:hypothetical protein